MASHDLTHDHLNALAERLEGSFRREVDNLAANVKDDFRVVHAHIIEVREQVAAQTGQIAAGQLSIAAVNDRVTAVRHDLAGHKDAHESFSSIVAALKAMMPPPSQAVAAPSQSGDASVLSLKSTSRTAFVAGVSATILALAGVGNLAWDAVRAYIPTFIAAWRNP